MAIYQENPDGSLTCIKADTTLSDVITEKTNSLLEQGLEVTPCVKELLELPVPTNKKGV